MCDFPCDIPEKKIRIFRRMVLCMHFFLFFFVAKNVRFYLFIRFVFKTRFLVLIRVRCLEFFPAVFQFRKSADRMARIRGGLNAL